MKSIAEAERTTGQDAGFEHDFCCFVDSRDREQDSGPEHNVDC